MNNIHPNQSRYMHMTSNELDRRDFMQKMVALFGVSAATAVLSGCSVPSTDDSTSQRPFPPQNGTLLSEYEATVLYTICDTILPKTDTPSATAVGCHQFVPHQLTHCHSKQQQDDCIHIINTLDKSASEKFSQALPLLNVQQQQQILTNFEQTNASTDDEKNQFRFLKALIVFGYFTSEVGASKALNYQAVPGGFIGSVPMTANTKGSGALDYY
jgi:hypothetical protein